MELLLVEKNGKRYVGEQSVQEDCYAHCIKLTKAYELMRMQAMGPQGPQLSHGFLPVGLDGAEDWVIFSPDGYREIRLGDPLVQGYQGARARDAGLTLASSVPSGLSMSASPLQKP